MAKKTPEQIAEKYQRGVAGAGQDYSLGVQNPSRPWAASTQKGAARWATDVTTDTLTHGPARSSR